jgi:hypothetical protein
LGIDLIHVHQLTNSLKTRGFSYGLSLQWNTGHPKVTQNHTLKQLYTILVTINLLTNTGTRPGPPKECLVHISTPGQPLLMGGPFLVTPSQHGQAVVPVQNYRPYKTLVQNKDPVGVLENIENCDTHVDQS